VNLGSPNQAISRPSDLNGTGVTVNVLVLRLDHLGAIEAQLGHHRRIRYAGEEWTISYTPGKGGGTPAQDGRERGFARWSYPDPVFAT
jgi:hypothetical protein